MKLLCWLGIHWWTHHSAWLYKDGHTRRFCIRCYKTQRFGYPEDMEWHNENA